MRIDDHVLLDIIGRLKNTEDTVRTFKEERNRLNAFHNTLKELYNCSGECRSGYDKTVKVLRKRNFKLHVDYEELLAYRKKLKAERYAVAKKLAAMKSNKLNKEKPDE